MRMCILLFHHKHFSINIHIAIKYSFCHNEGWVVILVHTNDDDGGDDGMKK